MPRTFLTRSASSAAHRKYGVVTAAAASASLCARSTNSRPTDKSVVASVATEHRCRLPVCRSSGLLVIHCWRCRRTREQAASAGLLRLDPVLRLHKRTELCIDVLGLEMVTIDQIRCRRTSRLDGPAGGWLQGALRYDARQRTSSNYAASDDHDVTFTGMNRALLDHLHSPTGMHDAVSSIELDQISYFTSVDSPCAALPHMQSLQLYLRSSWCAAGC